LIRGFPSNTFKTTSPAKTEGMTVHKAKESKNAMK